MEKKILLPALIICGLFSCSKEGPDAYTYNQETIYSTSYDTRFSEAVAFISPYILDNGVQKYIVTDKLTNITISINDDSWQTNSSFELNTNQISNKELVNGYWVTTEKVSYPVVVNINLRPEDITTAGEYATLVSNYFFLLPGVYACKVESFTLTSTTGQSNTINLPLAYTTIEVKEGEISASMEDFEVQIQ
ncbi:MAG: hypothetical protein LUE98_02100 [Tannerellaceae bacterium]|nr:hypothetical protein [Tannerellaceae bacterium]